MPKRATVQYRYLNREGLPADLILKRAVVEALRTPCEGGTRGNAARHRIIDVDLDGSVVILNQLSDAATWDGAVVGGQLIHLQPGSDVQAVTQSLEDDHPHFLVERLNIGNDARVAKGILYFALVGDHVGLIESTAVKGGTLERYLSRFLLDAGLIQVGQVIHLNASIQTGDGTRLPSSTEVTIAAGRPRRGGDARVSREAGRDRRSDSVVERVLRVLGWSDDAVARLREDVPEGGHLEGDFRFSIKESRTKRAISRGALDEMLRNMDPRDVHLRGDGVEKDGYVMLSRPALIQSTGDLLDPAHAMAEIVRALREWSEQGRIDCDFRP